MSRKFIPKIKYINNAFDALEPLGLYTGKQIRNDTVCPILEEFSYE